MPTSQAAPLIAVVNSSRDVVETIADILREEGGYRAVTYISAVATGAAETARFLRDVQPAACVYAVAFSYERSWNVFQQVRDLVRDIPFVLTTANVEVLEQFAGPVDAIELVGKPFDLQDLLNAVERTLQHSGMLAASGDD